MIQTHCRNKGMILRMADVYFYDPSCDETLPKADVITFYQSAVPRCGAKPYQTLHIDLTRSPDDLLEQMDRRTRSDLKKACREPFEYHFTQTPTSEDIRLFYSLSCFFCDRKGIVPADQSLMNCLAKDRALHISSVQTREEGVLCQHVHLSDGVRARTLYSASIRMEITDRKRHRIACANRALHWNDMLYYQTLGYGLYDFGGITPNSDNPCLQGITAFKTGFGGTPVTEYHYMQPCTPLGRLALHLTRRGNQDL